MDELSPSGYAQVVEELVGGQVQKTYTWGHMLINQRRLVAGSYVVSYYGQDGSENVRQLFDNSGAVTDTFAYDAFGILIGRTGTTANSYLYRSQQFDADLGFYYNRARYYDQTRGRFFNRDQFDGISFVPQSLHKYLYAHGDPMNLLDPSGYSTLADYDLLLWLLLGASVAATIYYTTKVVEVLRRFPPVPDVWDKDKDKDKEKDKEKDKDKDKKRPLGVMRVQLQTGNVNVFSIPVWAPDERGVAVLHLRTALHLLFLVGKGMISSNPKVESAFLGAIARSSMAYGTFPPIGVSMIGNFWREEFRDRKGKFRVDSENLAGVNLRY
ncbi:MAG: RHS repeat-associated core domain-containing protein [Acidobacteria bacterium]|nr:RHS repeat-associated core domain-containing protein [Acidobacteriota bacterium]